MAPLGKVGKFAEEFEWRIPNFSLSNEPDTYKMSPNFSFAGKSWNMAIFPNGITKQSTIGRIGLYISMYTPGFPINLKYTFSLKTSKGEKFHEKHFAYDYTAPRQISGTYDYITRKQLFKKKSELLPDDTLTVVCTMNHPKPVQNKAGVSTAQCFYCEMILNSEYILSHENRCRKTQIECPRCSKVVCMVNLKRHKCVTSKEGDETTTIERPEAVSQTILKKSPLIIRKCRKCSAVIDSRKLYDHKCVNTREEEDETITIHRPEATSLRIRKKSPLITRKCPKCLVVVDSGKLDDHMCLVTKSEEDNAAAIQLSETTSLTTPENSPLITSRKCPVCCAVVDSGKLYDHKCLVARAEAIEKLLRDLKRLFVTGDHSDTKLRVQMEEFRLHKCILSARNPSFELMFKKELRDRTADTVYITDCEPGSFHSLIHYIYTGTADKISPENVCNLYEIAYGYQEEQLKAECLQFMKNSISVDNFCDIIALALKHDEQPLLKAAKEFYPCKAKEIIRSVKWKSFMKNYPEQADELFMEALDYQ